MFEKNGNLTEKSINDFNTKQAAYVDEDGYLVADEENKDKLKKPVKLKTENQP